MKVHNAFRIISIFNFNITIILKIIIFDYFEFITGSLSIVIHVYVHASITPSLGIFVGLFLGGGLGIGSSMYNASLPKHLKTKIALHCISNRHASTAIIQAIYMYTYLKKFARNKFCSVQFIIKAHKLINFA